MSMKRLMTVNVFSCSCDNVILPSFITFIVYQKETKSQVILKETLSQVNNINSHVKLLLVDMFAILSFIGTVMCESGVRA